MISPFANNSESMQVGELVIENQEDKVILYGDIDIYRTAKGLEQAQQLHELFGKIVQELTTAATEEGSFQAKSASDTTLNEPKNQENSDEDSQLIDNPFL